MRLRQDTHFLKADFEENIPLAGRYKSCEKIVSLAEQES